MRRSQFAKTLVGSLSIALVAACAGGGFATGPNDASLRPALGVERIERANKTGKNLYVANATTVTVYSPTTGSLLRSYGAPAKDASSLAFDGHGNLYVGSLSHPHVAVFKAATTSLLQSFHVIRPVALAFDASDDLYVASNHTIEVFQPGATLPIYLYTKDVVDASAMAISTTGYMYVANYVHGHRGNNVVVYPPGSGTPTEIITQGVDQPSAIAFDSQGNLYVVNSLSNTITVYAPGSTSVLRKIARGVFRPLNVAIDASDNVYVANKGGGRYGSVVEYLAGTETEGDAITDGIKTPVSLSFDNSGNLYVANATGHTVTVYAPGAMSPLRGISKGVKAPAVLEFGP